MRAGQAKITDEIKRLIDTKINDLRTEQKSEINTRIDHSEMYLNNEFLLFNNTIEKLSLKVKEQATEIARLKSAIPGGI